MFRTAHVDFCAPSSFDSATLTSTHPEPESALGRRHEDGNGNSRTAKISLSRASPHFGFNRRLIIATESPFLRTDYVDSQSADTPRRDTNLVNFMTYHFEHRDTSFSSLRLTLSHAVTKYTVPIWRTFLRLRNKYPDERPSFLVFLSERHIVFCSVRPYGMVKEYTKRSEMSRALVPQRAIYTFFFLIRGK